MNSSNICCRHCGSAQVIRHGYTAKGKQRYKCRACSRSFLPNPGTNSYSAQAKEQILRAYHERTSLRGVTRIFGVSRQTVSSWLKKSQSFATSGTDLGSSTGR
jgi:transposase-like protein